MLSERKVIYCALNTWDHQKMLPKRQSLDGMLLKESIARDNDILKLSNIVYWVELSVIFQNINWNDTTHFQQNKFGIKRC